MLHSAGAFSDFKDFGFRLVQHLFDVPTLRIVSISSNLCASLCELSHDGTAAHDFGVAGDIDGRGSILCQIHQIAEAAGFFQHFFTLQHLFHGNGVGRTVAFGQVGYGAENQAVFIAVEVFFRDGAGNAVPGGGIHH